MNKIIIFLLSISYGFAQTYSSKRASINDFNGVLAADTVLIEVENLPSQIDENFGLAKVCLNIQHERVSDLKLELFSPDGNEIWLTNRNGRDDGRNYFQTCFRSNGFSGYIHEAKAPFIGEFIPDGRMEYINNGQNPNGTWKLLIRDLAAGVDGQLDYVRLTFEDNPMPNYKIPPCSIGYGLGCLCADGTEDCLLLPDLVLLPSFTINQIKEYPYNHYRYGGQLRLAATIANIGNGPIQTFGKNEWYCGEQQVEGSMKCEDGSASRQNLYQRVYSKSDGELQYTDIKAGTNYYDDKPGHDHFHVDSWVSFRLKKDVYKKGKLKKTKLIAEGQKVSYCLFDTGICNNEDSLCYVGGQTYGQKNLLNYGMGSFADCKEGEQGISVGGYDTYGMMYEGQYIDLPKRLKSGTYILEIEVDPEQKYQEISKENNLYRQEIVLSRQRKR
ncbi:lysyl oxidase family protein [Arcticibacterium luteifluviistationis]|uniref:P/Homo B domain-containing protein n=1 Tax=Arcticibacterium luteifluviistationis TaxID=1784714 RepID=A0A2Z4GCV2_9BACT|nr:lysyl oxidase family protein [Arcticibacterium luteifluviistationis]AWV98733.1 hypothetical protein DJ013_11340 [Arcticibacterium luteifluviistationis]